MKKRVKRKFNFFKFIIFILVIFIIFFVVKYLLNIKTKNIIILNNSFYNDEEIIETSGIEDYPKFILLSKSKIKKKLKSLDLIEDVSIKKDIHFALTLDIKEKKILYLVRSTNEYKLSDNSSVSLDNVYGYPTLINFVPEDVESKFVKALSKVDQNIISLISEIEYSKTSFDNNRFLLYMNDGNEVYINIAKMEVLNKYISIKSSLGSKKGILYLDNGNYYEIKEK